MHRRDLLSGLAAIGALAAPGWARAAARPPVKLSSFFPYLDLYLNLPPAQRSHFSLAYYAFRDQRPAADLKAVLIGPNGARRPIAIQPDGRVGLMPTLAELHGPEQVEVDSPGAEKIGVRLEIQARVAPGPNLDVRDLELALAQANAAIASKAGLLRFAVPKLTCAYLIDAGSGRAVLDDGRAVPLPVVTTRPFAGTPYFDATAAPEARTIALARPPSRAVLGGRPR